MDLEQGDDLKPMPEQITYANLLFIGAWVGIVLMMLTYLIYVSGLMEAHVDIAAITSNWDKGVDAYLRITGSPQGWGWIRLLDRGDYLNYLGLVLLAILTMFCYLFLIAGYRKRRDWMFFFISLLEVAVLALAASGILGAGGH